MTVEYSPSIFESFNARALNPGEVARTFVPSDAFEKLARRRHSLVVGPRGSGKTTLLKMLQPAALESWNHPEAEEYCQSIDFSGVFIPFDRSWRAQMDALGQRHGRERSLLLGTAAFTTHVFRSLVNAFQSKTSESATLRAFRRVELTPKEHDGLAGMLYSAWGLPPGPRSMHAVRAALSNRLTNIGMLGRRSRTGMPEEQASRDPEYLYMPFLDGVSAALDAWEAVTGMADERWGMLFDELELAPPEIKAELFSAMRSRDSRLIFKLALSPFDGEVEISGGPEDPQRNNDYEQVSLWFSGKRDTVPFCAKLWRSMLNDRGREFVAPERAFGRSVFKATDEWRRSGMTTAYAPGTRLQRQFTQLEAVDQSFRSYLHGRGYSSHRLDRMPPGSRASEVRKIAPLVTARLFFLRTRDEESGSAKRRSRKRLTLYAGWESLCAVSEGNPRWFIGMVNTLLDAAAGGPRLRIPPSDQAQVIEDAADRYRAALRTIPVVNTMARSKSRGLLTLLDALGDYFHYEQILKAFSPSPPGSFKIDRDVSDDLIEAIGQALNAGALVLVDSDDPGGIASFRGRRLRMCYLLAAHYEIMPRLGRYVGLKSILSAGKYDARDTIQLSLT